MPLPSGLWSHAAFPRGSCEAGLHVISGFTELSVCSGQEPPGQAVREIFALV